MFEDVLEIHRQIYYGSEKFKNNHSNQGFDLGEPIEKGFISTQNDTPNLELSSESIEKATIHAPKWNTYYKEKTDDDNLENLSDKLEFYSRRYGGGLR